MTSGPECGCPEHRSMTAPLSAAERARLDEVQAAATPGQWEHVVDQHRDDEVEHSIWSEGTGDFTGGRYVIEELVELRNPADAAAIVALHNAWPRIAALVRRQAAALAAVETVAAEYEAIFRNRRLSGAHRSTCLGVAQRIRAALAAGGDGQATT